MMRIAHFRKHPNGVFCVFEIVLKECSNSGYLIFFFIENGQTHSIFDMFFMFSSTMGAFTSGILYVLKFLQT